MGGFTHLLGWFICSILPFFLWFFCSFKWRLRIGVNRGDYALAVLSADRKKARVQKIRNILTIALMKKMLGCKNLKNICLPMKSVLLAVLVCSSFCQADPTSPNEDLISRIKKLSVLTADKKIDALGWIESAQDTSTFNKELADIAIRLVGDSDSKVRLQAVRCIRSLLGNFDSLIKKDLISYEKLIKSIKVASESKSNVWQLEPEARLLLADFYRRNSKFHEFVDNEVNLVKLVILKSQGSLEDKLQAMTLLEGLHLKSSDKVKYSVYGNLLNDTNQDVQKFAINHFIEEEVRYDNHGSIDACFLYMSDTIFNLIKIIGSYSPEFTQREKEMILSYEKEVANFQRESGIKKVNSKALRTNFLKKQLETLD